jgi:putative transposase
MGINNPINSDAPYFLTMTTVDWVDVFTRPVYKQIIVDSLRHCQKEKGLEIIAWVLMTNHLHLIARAELPSLSDVLRDFKKFTSKRISEEAQSEFESRRIWMMHRFEYNARFAKNKYFKVWQDGNEAKEIVTNHFLDQKIEYIHQNPVKAQIVFEPEHYAYSSAVDYAGGKGFLEILFP